MNKAEKDYEDLMNGMLSPLQNSWDIFEAYIKELKRKNEKEEHYTLIVQGAIDYIDELEEKNRKYEECLEDILYCRLGNIDKCIKEVLND